MKKIHEKFKSKILLLLILSLIVLLLFYFYKNQLQFFKMSTNRIAQQTILLDNNRILIIGGNNGKSSFGLKSAEIFNFLNKKSNIINEMNLPHQYHSLFRLNNDNILIVDINGIEIFDNKTNKFKLLKSKPYTRLLEFNSYSFNLIPKNRVLVIGGRVVNKGTQPTFINKVDIIDIEKDKVIKILNYNLNSHSTCLLSDGNVLLVGGTTYKNNKLELSKTINLFDSFNLNIKKIGELNIPVKKPYVFKLKNDKILIFGGRIFKRRVNNDFITTQISPYVQLYDLKNNKSSILSKSFSFKDYEIDDVLELPQEKFLLSLSNSKSNVFMVFDFNSAKITRLNTKFNNKFIQQNLILVKDNVLFSGGEKIPNFFIKYFSSMMCDVNQVCTRNPTNKIFISKIVDMK